MGTSHRKPTVKNMVGRLRDGLSTLFSLPDGWEIVLGNGGSTLFWDALIFGAIRERSLHFSFGEFSSKFAKGVAAAPHLSDPIVIESAPGTHPAPNADDSVDFYALTHNETSTGVMMPVLRPAGISPDAIVAVDATSAAGGLRWDPTECDIYYFAPQKCFGSDGGLWIAACSPTALERIAQINASDRWIPAGLDLAAAVENSLQNQTYNTPALATIFLAVHQIEWFNDQGGLDWSAGRSEASAKTIFDWAENNPRVAPFVIDPAQRSTVVATLDLDDSVSADDVSAVLRANGVVDTEGYRKLGRNQMRISLFPAIDPNDIAQLTRCIDFVMDAL